MLSIGAKGVVSVVANILPNEMSNLIKAFEDKAYDRAFDLHSNLYDISRNMFIEGNPVTVKAAMRILGLIDNDNVRLPLVSQEEKNNEKLRKLFKAKGLI